MREFLHPGASVLYSEDGVVALEKPAGVLTHPNRSSGKGEATLLGRPYRFEEEAYVLEESPRRLLYLVHRLDKDTSGIVLAAHDREVALALKAQFAERTVEKEYLALLCGTPAKPSGTWADYLEEVRERGSILVKVGRGKPNAESEFHVERAFREAGLALVLLRPKTGKTHQLRVQAARHGHAVAGDRRYGDFAQNRRIRQEFGLGRMFLHAQRITFKKQGKKGSTKVVSELPTALSEVLDRIGETPYTRGRL